MNQGDDWRLTGQERFLQGALLHKLRWTSPRPDWDHDHCAFCWQKFTEDTSPEALAIGYTTADRKHWICEGCFADFKDQFAWQLE
ncbi:MAG: hypothetical protein JNM56_33710 [Planctomycetia bacterium]|nr:hypothetical protein [Planctomycetia bacterium]